MTLVQAIYDFGSTELKAAESPVQVVALEILSEIAGIYKRFIAKVCKAVISIAGKLIESNQATV
jgi:hypothetical protein